MTNPCQVTIISKYRITGEALSGALTARNGKYQASYRSCCSLTEVDLEHAADVILLSCMEECPLGLQSSISAFPEAKHIVLSRDPNEAQQLEWLRQGAHGIVDESTAEVGFDLLDTIIDAVRSGILWAPRKILSRLLIDARTSSARPPVPEDDQRELSPREKELLGLVTLGLSNAEIATRLFISEKTVKGHLTNIYRKLEVSNRLQATLKVSRSPKTLL